MKKHTLFAFLGAGTLALSASVGFAAWTINAREAKDNASINVSADGTVNDNRIEISKSGTGTTSGFASSSGIAFRAVQNTAITNPWLSADPLDDSEKLSLTYNLYVKGKTGLKLSVNGKVVDVGEGTKYDTLAGSGIVGALPSISTSGIALTEQNKGSDSTPSTYFASIQLEFSWGSKFTSTKDEDKGKIVNPYTYYNQQKYSDPLAKDAKDTLSQLKNLEGYSGLQFQFTVSVAA